MKQEYHPSWATVRSGLFLGVTLNGSEPCPARVSATPDLAAVALNFADLGSVGTQNRKSGIKLEDTSFATGSLRVTSYARPGKLFTANRDLIVAEVATLKSQSLKRVVNAVVDPLRAGGS